MFYLKLLLNRKRWLYASFVIFVTFISLSFALHPYTQKGYNGKGKAGAEKFPMSHHANYLTHIKQGVNITGCPTDTSTTFAGRIDYIFQHLDKSQVPTGMLQEYGIDVLPPENFTGSNLNDSNYINIDEWRMLYANLYSYQINATANMDSLGGINSALQPYNNPDSIDALAVMFYYYNSFKSNAITSNLVKDSCDQLYDVPGRAQSPYQTDTLFAMAPVRQSLYTGSNNFIINTSLFYTNTGKTVSSMYITTDSTAYTWQAEPINTPFSLTFDSTGLQDLGIKIVFTDATQMIAHSKVDIYTNPNGSEEESVKENQGKGKVNPLYGNGPGQGIFLYYDWRLIADKAYLGQEDTGLVTVQLSVHNTSGHIQKPLIFIEGFDPTTGVGHNMGYYLTQLIPNITHDQNTYNPLNPNPSLITLNNELDSTDDYDVIYISFNNGMDYIERNAYLVETLIQQVNAWKAQYGVTTQNVVVGESMGAVIARYALRDMELNGINHQTRLFISHDGPQYGANVPVGYQLLVQHLAEFQIISAGFQPQFPYVYINWHDISPNIDQALDIFNSPAAKELLVQRYDLIHNSPTSYSIQSDNSAYANFQSEINSMGYPQDCRDISISDGACNGTQQFATGSQLFNGSNSSNNGINYFSQLGIAALGPALNVGINPVNNIWGQFPLALFSFNTKMFTNFNVWSVNNGSLLYQGEINIQRKILGIINLNDYLTKCDINSTSDMQPLDNAPGGIYNINKFIDVSDIESSIPLKYRRFFELNVVQPDFCFVPTVSSLAVQNPWPHLDESICDSLGCLSAFDDYYAPSSNLLHISYTQPMSDWIQQRQDSSFNCVKICSDNIQIMGGSSLCGSSVYNLSGAPSGAIISWTATPSGIVSLTPNGAQVTVTKIMEGTITLTATIANSCSSSFQWQKDIQIFGTPSISQINIEENGPSCIDGQSLSFGATYNGDSGCDLLNDGITEVDWQIMSPQPYQVTYNAGVYECSSGSVINPGISLYFSPPTTPFMLTLKARVKNECGEWSLWSPGYSFQISGCSAYSSLFSITPNPASGTITITSGSTNEQYSKIGEAGNNGFIKEVKIYASSGKIVKQQQFSNNASQVQMDVSTLAPGIYFVEISNGQHAETHKLVIAGNSTLTK
jgi:hypothetical protein